MTVKELIEQLQKCDENAQVRFTYWVDGENGDSGWDRESSVSSVQQVERNSDIEIPRAPLKRKKMNVVILGDL